MKLQHVITRQFNQGLEVGAAKIAVLTTGSDGRLEKGPKSLVEVIVVL